MKIGRNSPCPCGSGKKYKHCCQAKPAGMPLSQKLLSALIVFVLVGGAVAAFVAFSHRGENPGANRVWSEEHQHWH